MKHILDISVSIIALIILLPIIIIFCILIRLKLGSPIFFTQVRPGLHGKPFKMIKFRTMTDVRDENGNLLDDSQRLTPFGKLLRSTSIDELPELINVIKGDMSLVGPRPLLMEYLPLYSEHQHKRHLVRPGITGWAQVNGRNAISWEQKFDYDVWYVNNQSLLLDLKILALTVKKVLVREGISAEQHVTIERFKGSQE